MDIDEEQRKLIERRRAHLLEATASAVNRLIDDGFLPVGVLASNGRDTTVVLIAPEQLEKEVTNVAKKIMLDFLRDEGTDRMERRVHEIN